MLNKKIMKTKIKEKYHIRETENCGNCRFGNTTSNIDYWCNRHTLYIDTHCICDSYKAKEWNSLNKSNNMATKIEEKPESIKTAECEKVIWKEIDESGVFKTPYSPMEQISASATLQCHIGFGNDLDGNFDSVIDAMQGHAKNYHSEQLRQIDKAEIVAIKEVDGSK